jgi:hypothetical protein
MGYPVTKAISTEGGEADIFVIERRGREYVLRLYRQGKVPKPEIFEKLVPLSKKLMGQVVQIYETGFDRVTGRWFELQEYIKGGPFNVLLEQSRDEVIAEFPDVVRQLSEGISNLHDYGIIHRDIKPSNILVRSRRPLKLTIADFGISSMLAADISFKETRMANTPLYSAPESFSNIAGKSGDWWSLGVILLEILKGSHPLAGLSVNMIMREITTRGLEIPADLPKSESTLIKGLLTRDDHKRWRYREVNSWLAGRNDIPIYFEARREPGSKVPGGFDLPYKFLENTYYSFRELAQAFASSEQSWDNGTQHLARGYLRNFLEENKMFDEATQMDAEGTGTPHERMFSFIQKYYPEAGLIYRGNVLSGPAFLEWLRNEPKETPARRGILSELLNGSLSGLPSLARKHKLSFDPVTELLLSHGKPIDRETLASALVAPANPDLYIWGVDGPPPDQASALKFILAAGCPLMTWRQFEDKVPLGAVIPSDIFEGGFNQPATYKNASKNVLTLSAMGVFAAKNLFYKFSVLKVIGRKGTLKVSTWPTSDFAGYYMWLRLPPGEKDAPKYVHLRDVAARESQALGKAWNRFVSPTFILGTLFPVLLALVYVVWFLLVTNSVQAVTAFFYREPIIGLFPTLNKAVGLTAYSGIALYIFTLIRPRSKLLTALAFCLAVAAVLWFTGYDQVFESKLPEKITKNIYAIRLGLNLFFCLGLRGLITRAFAPNY